jgi:RNA polymerase sigma factor (sigma-70 family)
VIREVSVEEMSIDRGPSASGPADVVLERDAIRRAFARLHPDKRLLLVLRHVDGRSVLDIARLLRIPEGTAKWRLHAARAELQRALDAEER